MATDLRVIFKAVPTPCPSASLAAMRFQRRWLDAPAITERDSIRDDLRRIQPRKKAIYVACLVTLYLAGVSQDFARGFVEHMRHGR